MKHLKWVLTVLLLVFSGVANAQTYLYEGEWVVSFDNNGTPEKFAGGPVSILLKDIDPTHRELTIQMSSDIDNGTGVCGNDATVTVVMNGVLSAPVWAYSITSESEIPVGVGSDYPTFGVAGEILKFTNMAPGFVDADSNIDGDFINAPFCANITATGMITNAQTPTAGDSIDIDFLVDDFESGTISALFISEVVFEDSFELVSP